MDAILGLSGLFGFLVFLVLLIIKAIKKKPKKIALIGLAVCFTLFCIGASLSVGNSGQNATPSDGDISAWKESLSEIVPPTTEAPSTDAPTSEPTGTEPPSTMPPTTEPPATEPPTTVPPTTQPPATEPPTTEPPATEPPTQAPTQNPAIKEYVLNTNTMKFHKPGCHFVKTIHESHRQYFTGTREEVLKMGYEPCQSCNP